MYRVAVRLGMHRDPFWLVLSCVCWFAAAAAFVASLIDSSPMDRCLFAGVAFVQALGGWFYAKLSRGEWT